MSNSAFFSLKTKAALITTVILWASAFVGIRAGLQGYSPGGLACLRFLIASVCMYIVYLLLPPRETIPLRDKALLLLIGIVGIGFYQIALNYGELSVSSGLASFIISQSPIITVTFAILFLSEPLKLPVFIGMLISILGVGLITLGSAHQFNFQMGFFYILFATLVSSIYSLMQKPFLKKYHAIEVTAYIIWGSLFALVIYLPNVFHDVQTASLQATLSVIYLGIFPAAIAYVAWSYALKEIPAARAVSFLYFMPIVATILGWIWLGEIPAWVSLVGGLLALCGVWIVNHSYSRGTAKV